MAETKGDIGLIGLAVMGQNLILNMNDKGYTVVAYNRTQAKVDKFLAGEASGTKVQGASSLEELVGKLKSPRVVMIMIKSGSPVDGVIDELKPLLSPGDVIIDGGNEDYRITNRRVKELGEAGILHLGCGVSGGEEGARFGPSLMPGGAPEAWPIVKDLLQATAAKTPDGEPCCDFMGSGGAGHFVKMTHNGIEYGDMQLICEAYSLMLAQGMDHDELAATFTEWNSSELDSYLIEITAEIMAFRTDDGEPLLPLILDKAGQKGTGRLTAISALDFGIPVTLIAEAVFARCLSALKDQRVRAAPQLSGPAASSADDRTAFLDKLRSALYAAKILSYAQGFMLLAEASAKFEWELNMASIALTWREGCIIRSAFLGNIADAYHKDPSLENLLFDDFFNAAITKHESALREVVAYGVLNGIALPAFSAALSFYDGFRTADGSACLIQALRDRFGAHQYELKSNPGTFIHTNWTGHGGDVASSTYNA
ncbi:6-phosphogluconate dehydrogenase, decarboxylating [Thecamonas trahens ATCC 50062]|uniref:6-phosphogluconate dehydrogenase, decarboxylating n=1 Tax=Thecamonas trahens ATCC 50062 TaxID=461836 RepID=A0A0L0DMW5_THETB|nr:6-phosphogluconate dehydrogenase, decarboxylating [Thecamonas trahens ATCC 50062]KNC53376.1 6-phosphogluconate dehydrogenase, decarboxylating [Thecamonas trahens ATCC 50062]|eukprot:XP_013754421.1 6-phosphogluconate dehydrogenase, decarboxylating [Thecamonas trahens ATCC 50062]